MSDTDVHDRLSSRLDRLPIDVDRSLDAVVRRGVRRTRVARGATIAVAALVAAVGVVAVWRLSGLGGGTRPGAGEFRGGIAYMRVRLSDGDPRFQAVIAREDGSGRTNLVSGFETEMWPTWSPDGRSLAFAGGAPDASPGLYVASVDDANTGETADGLAVEPRLIVDGVEGAISWSPEGDRLAFVRQSPGDVWVVRTDGSQPTRLVGGRWFHVAWSPSGDALALAGAPGAGSEIEEPHGIYIVRQDGTGLRRLTASSETAEDAGYDFFPSWSPDGRTIAFVRNSELDDITLESDLYMVGTEGSRLRRLTDLPGIDTVPVWSPDGKRILFSSGRSALDPAALEQRLAGLSLYLLNPKTGMSELFVLTEDAALFGTSWIAPA